MLSLLVLATTSHDFWPSFLTPRLWKALHYLIYPAYGTIGAHVSFGVLQDLQNLTFAVAVAVCASTVAALHVAAALHGTWRGDPVAAAGDWVEVCRVAEIAEGRTRVAGKLVVAALGIRVHDRRVADQQIIFIAADQLVAAAAARARDFLGVAEELVHVTGGGDQIAGGAAGDQGNKVVRVASDLVVSIGRSGDIGPERAHDQGHNVSSRLL